MYLRNMCSYGSHGKRFDNLHLASFVFVGLYPGYIRWPAGKINDAMITRIDMRKHQNKLWSGNATRALMIRDIFR